MSSLPILLRLRVVHNREGADRDLRFRIDIAEGVSAETCTATCSENGYGLAGLEYGRECC